MHLQGANSSSSSSSGGEAPSASKARKAGPFTFQALIRDDGDIAFSYKSVPRVIDAIDDEEHPVKVGLSDAYIIDRTIFCEQPRKYRVTILACKNLLLT